MENGKEKKKAIIISSMSIVALLLIVGISYAFWQTTKIQEDTNIIASGCFGVSLEGNNPISLSNAYPVTEEVGMKGEPYTFTITNTCEGEAIYNVNLESLSNTTFQNDSIRVALDDSNKLYSEYGETEKYYEDSKETRTLISGTLESNGSVTYNLRIWIDENAPNTEQNKVFASKIVITTGEGGEIIKSLADQVELGDYISMTPTLTSYTIPVGVTGYESSQEINPSELNLWRVIRKNSDGTVDVVSEYVSSNLVYFKGKAGYLNYIGVLNQIAAQYTNTKYVKSTRNIGYNSQTEYIIDTSKIDNETAPWEKHTSESLIHKKCDTESFLCGVDESLGAGDINYSIDYDLVQEVLGTLKAQSPSNDEGSYWLSSRFYYYLSSNYWYWHGRTIIKDGSLSHDNMFGYDKNIKDDILDTERKNSVRPVLTLKANLVTLNGDGKSISTAYTFE